MKHIDVNGDLAGAGALRLVHTVPRAVWITFADTPRVEEKRA